MKKAFLIIQILFFSAIIAKSQESYQVFSVLKFKVKCNCALEENTTYIQLANKQGVDNVIAAYTCVEYLNDYTKGVLVNLNILDLSDSYSKLKESQYGIFETEFLNSYTDQLKKSNISYSYTSVNGITAIQYEFDQNGLPTIALVFLKNKNSYLIQVGTRTDLEEKFNKLKNSFTFL